MKPDFSKGNGLIPVIIQDEQSLQVLMLGYMNEEAYKKTMRENRVTFFSRSKNRLWTKGETSSNYLTVKSLHLDCDLDSLLIKVNPAGPVCHTGQTGCFEPKSDKGFLYDLEATIAERIASGNTSSYTSRLYQKGINKMAQKVGEEAVELVIEAKDENDELFKNEAADLLYHLLILLHAKKFRLEDIEAILRQRSKPAAE